MRFLVPIEAAPTDEQLEALREEFAGMPDATVVLVHVLPLPEAVDPAGAARAEAFLLGAAEAVAQTGAEVLHYLRCGDPAEEIAALSGQIEADLIVMHGRAERLESASIRHHVSEDVRHRADRPNVS